MDQDEDSAKIPALFAADDLNFRQLRDLDLTFRKIVEKLLDLLGFEIEFGGYYDRVFHPRFPESSFPDVGVTAALWAARKDEGLTWYSPRCWNSSERVWRRAWVASFFEDSSLRSLDALATKWSLGRTGSFFRHRIRGRGLPTLRLSTRLNIRNRWTTIRFPRGE
jgi:hypothetical protein